MTFRSDDSRAAPARDSVIKHTQITRRPPFLEKLMQLSYDAEVEHPSHYLSHPSGVECIEITEHMDFCLGNAIKYIWRAGLKSDDPAKDLHKAIWYLERKIDLLRRTQD